MTANTGASPEGSYHTPSRSPRPAKGMAKTPRLGEGLAMTANLALAMTAKAN